jgi:HK97 family phage prohead protease
MTNLERRVVTMAPEPLGLRHEGDGLPVIAGYAAVFDSLSEDFGGWRERIKVGAFTRSLREGADVRALVDHDPSKILGRNLAGTLRIKPNGKGLYVEIDAPDTSIGRDIQKSIKRGDVNGMSFAFIDRSNPEENWHMEDGVAIRELLDVDLRDVSVVTYPAYPQTDVAVRSAWGLAIPEKALSEFRMRAAKAEEDRQKVAALRADLVKRVG